MAGPQQNSSARDYGGHHDTGEHNDYTSPRDFIEQPPPSVYTGLDGKRVTNFKDSIPLEDIVSVVDWLSKKAPVYQVQYQ